MKKVIINFLSYTAALLLLLGLFTFFIKPQQLQMLLNFSFHQIFIAFLLSLGPYIGNGVEYYFICRKFGFQLDKKDIILLPLAMNLAGTVIPFQGAMAYQVFFFKKKYNMEISRSFSVALFLYLLTMVFSGIAGIGIAFAKETSWLFFLVSTLFLLSPGLVILAEHGLRSLVLPIPALEKIRLFFLSTVSGITSLWTDLRLLGILITIYFLRLGGMLLLFLWIADCLENHVTFLSLLLLNLWNMLSLLIKITPNNLGISQVVSGILFAMIGFSVEQGILLSFAVNIIFVAVALTLGTAAVIWNFRDISQKRKKAAD